MSILPLIRCLFVLLIRQFHFRAGGGSRVQSLPPTKTLWFSLVIHGLISHAYLPIFSEMGRGSTQEPPCRSFEFSFHCTVVAIWNYFRSNMYGSATSEPSSEQGRRKHTSRWSSRRVNQSFLSVCRDCFVHERCTPQQNSQWCFWASVCVCVHVCV